MNKTLSDFAKRELKKGLAKLEEKNVLLFKRMYSPKHLGRSINDVVDSMPDDKLSWAMQQVQRTIKQATNS